MRSGCIDLRFLYLCTSWRWVVSFTPGERAFGTRWIVGWLDPQNLSGQYKKQTPWPKSAIELYRPSDFCLLAKIVPTFADRGCRVVSATDPTAVFSVSRPGLEDMAKSKFLTLQGFELPVVQPVASRYTDCTTATVLALGLRQTYVSCYFLSVFSECTTQLLCNCLHLAFSLTRIIDHCSI
jgi:hypothetical protein